MLQQFGWSESSDELRLPIGTPKGSPELPLRFESQIICSHVCHSWHAYSKEVSSMKLDPNEQMLSCGKHSVQHVQLSCSTQTMLRPTGGESRKTWHKTSSSVLQGGAPPPCTLLEKAHQLDPEGPPPEALNLANGSEELKLPAWKPCPQCASRANPQDFPCTTPKLKRWQNRSLGLRLGVISSSAEADRPLLHEYCCSW